jgi:hypothetical protein
MGSIFPASPMRAGMSDFDFRRHPDPDIPPYFLNVPFA